MIAPRKKLWSTPSEALQAAIALLKIHEKDVVYDIGCGDGNFLSLVATVMSTEEITLNGVEIEEERARQAEQRISECCGPRTTVSILVKNALEVDYSGGTCFFMYLIPRGLRLISPILANIKHPIRIVTFMNPLPFITPTESVKIESAGHFGSQWPLYYYEVSDPSRLLS
jgi:ubiquinone/menaquinone biosynthesis C-methylase UbiE